MDPDVEVFEQNNRNIKNSIIKMAEIEVNIDEEEEEKG